MQENKDHRDQSVHVDPAENGDRKDLLVVPDHPDHLVH